jgi:hypothetical protein
MTAIRPPAVATWLLERLTSGPLREALIGDLIEHYTRRPSRFRYWRQVLTAILTTALRDGWRDKLIIVRGALTGCLAFVLFKEGGDAIFYAVGKVVWNWTVEHGFDTLRVLWFSPRYQLPPAIVLTVSCVSSGWMVARVNGSRPAALLACLMMMFFFNGFFFGAGRLGQAYQVGILHVGPYAYLLQAIAFFLLMPFLVLVGGLVRIAKHPANSSLRGWIA